MLQPILLTTRLARLLVFPLILLTGVNLVAKMEIDPAQVREIASMLPEHAMGLGQPASDRKAWDKLAAMPVFQQWLQGAHNQINAQLPKADDALYLDFSKTGNRDRWQNTEFQVRNRMSTLALAECLEDKGAFLKPLEEAIKELCAERTWVYPAHDKSLRNFNGTQIDIDLGSSRVGWDLATIKYLLGDKLSPATRQLIHDNVEKRILKPYRDMVTGERDENGWLRVTQNWNAVCHAGVVGAALAESDSAEDRAWFIAAAQHYLPNFLSGFGKDGYCSEGMGYWNYGFGHYLMLSETVRQSTGGKIDWMAEPGARLPSLFGRRAEIMFGVYPSIADCHPGSRPDPQIDTYICQRFGLSPCTPGRDIFTRPSGPLFTTALFSFLPEQMPKISSGKLPEESPLRTWFSDGGVLICRQKPNIKVPFAVTLKGGNNNEHHNHNDLGSYIVMVNKSTVLIDPGSEVYTARTFSSKRYESDVLNSFGHDVPVVAGKLQSTGAKFRAEVLRKEFTDEKDTLSLNLAKGYAVPTLKRLERAFTYQRGDKPSLTVLDEVEFTQPETFETALVTWGQWKKVSDKELLFTESTGAVRVKIETGGVPFDITSKQLEANVTTATKATRLGLVLKQPVTKGTVRLTITPE